MADPNSADSPRSIQELSEKISSLSERQNSQYTDVMLLLKKIDEKILAGTTEPRSEDDLYDDAKELVIEMQKVSTSFLQRALGIGYSRACGLIDRLESDKIIGPARGSKPRAVLKKE